MSEKNQNIIQRKFKYPVSLISFPFGCSNRMEMNISKFHDLPRYDEIEEKSSIVESNGIAEFEYNGAYGPLDKASNHFFFLLHLYLYEHAVVFDKDEVTEPYSIEVGLGTLVSDLGHSQNTRERKHVQVDLNRWASGKFNRLTIETEAGEKREYKNVRILDWKPVEKDGRKISHELVVTAEYLNILKDCKYRLLDFDVLLQNKNNAVAQGIYVQMCQRLNNQHETRIRATDLFNKIYADYLKKQGALYRYSEIIPGKPESQWPMKAAPVSKLMPQVMTAVSKLQDSVPGGLAYEVESGKGMDTLLRFFNTKRDDVQSEQPDLNGQEVEQSGADINTSIVDPVSAETQNKYDHIRPLDAFPKNKRWEEIVLLIPEDKLDAVNFEKIADQFAEAGDVRSRQTVLLKVVKRVMKEHKTGSVKNFWPYMFSAIESQDEVEEKKTESRKTNKGKRQSERESVKDRLMASGKLLGTGEKAEKAKADTEVAEQVNKIVKTEQPKRTRKKPPVQKTNKGDMKATISRTMAYGEKEDEKFCRELCKENGFDFDTLWAEVQTDQEKAKLELKKKQEEAEAKKAKREAELAQFVEAEAAAFDADSLPEGGETPDAKQQKTFETLFEDFSRKEAVNWAVSENVNVRKLFDEYSKEKDQDKVSAT